MELKLLDPATQLHQIRTLWRRLSEMSDVSYFLSWGWVEHWLASLSPETRVRLAVVSGPGATCSAFFLGEAPIVRHQFLRSRGLFLNTAGALPYDDLCIEHNGILSDGPLTYSLKEMLNRLPDSWEEFVMPAMSASRLPRHWLNESVSPYTVLIQREAPSPYVDLEVVRRQAGDYLALLGAATRANIRRSYRLLAPHGPVTCEVAGTADRALEIFDEMIRLHQHAWRKRGRDGAFASEYFRAFHAGLITRRFQSGEIQLLRIAAGGTTVGCLYNFVFRGTVSFYQSGVNYAMDHRVNPGLVCHAEAVQHNARAQQRIYDFLGGEARYKANLSTHAGRLIWLTVQKSRPKFLVERTLRASKRFITRQWQSCGKSAAVGADA